MCTRNYEFSSLNTNTGKNKNFYIKRDNRFYLVKSLYREHDKIFFEGIVIKDLGALSFNYQNKHIELDYIHKCEISTNIVKMEFLKDTVKLHFFAPI